MIYEKAYAKINLSLRVFGKRPDGYHNLKSLVCPLELHDVLSFSPSNEVVLKADVDIEDNIVIKTANLLKDRYHVTEGALITLKKNIPVQAGLAGGSADSSATLRGLNRLWNLNLPLSELEKMSAELGSDNPYCIYNKLTIMSGRGECLSFIQGHIKANVLLIKPPYGVSTKSIFTAYEEEEEHDANPEKWHDLSLEDLKKFIFNDLQKTTMSLYPALNDLKTLIEEKGFEAFMSGSGPTLFVLDNNEERLNNLLLQLPKDNKYIVTKTL